MRSICTKIAAAALLAAPALASAQSVAESRVFAGCDIYVCGTFTLSATGDPTDGYRVSLFGPLTLRAPLVTGEFYRLYDVFLGTSAFAPGDECDGAAGVDPVDLVGHRTGDVVQIHAGGCWQRELRPLADAYLVGERIRPDGTIAAERVAISLTAAPEPATLTLTLGGLAVLGAGVRRRRA